MPIGLLWIGKRIIDVVVAARSGAADISTLWMLVGVEVSIALAGEMFSRISVIAESLFGDRLSSNLNEKLILHAATLDLCHFEDPAFYDRLERAQRQTTGRIGLLAQLLAVVQDLLTLISLSTAILLYSPWLLGLLVVALVPAFLGETHFAALEYWLLYRWTPERRQLDYLRFLGASDKTVKEVQVFGFSGWLLRRYHKLSERFYQANKQLSIRKGIAATTLSAVSLLGYYSAYVIILARAFSGSISVGTLTFLAGSFARSRDMIERVLVAASNIFEQSLYIKDLLDFFELKPAIVSHPGAPAFPSKIKAGVVFEDVGFRYPGSDAWALRHVNLRISAAERVAIVGENGAGKTTLAKLLARLYDPIEGRILVDGLDLREYDLNSVRQSIAVIFQDFVRYDLRLDENIGLGGSAEVREYLDRMESMPRSGADTTHSAIADAAEKSLAASIISRLPSGYRQMLGRRFEGGVELSGGEWQKVALARAYIRESQIVILDEPTGALDARAEDEVFTRFTRLVEGRLALLISHRFSTVRMADRIILLQHGSILEEGSHEQLLHHNGLYAELFRLQAAGYR